MALAACLTLSACSRPEAETAKLQRYYAKMGDNMTPTTKRVEQRNPQRGVAPALSPTNAPVSR